MQVAKLRMLLPAISMVLESNADKYHLLVRSNENASIGVDEYDVCECEKLLGVKFDAKLTFEKQIKDICCKTSRKITPYAE